MAELTFKSAGVSTREIDLSGPTPLVPQGVPAGVIGTAVAGPAFVPITFANFSEFNSIFGGADGEKFGPIAVSEWLKNAQSCTYIRVLGAGNGKQRNSDGTVTNAGFFVGDKIIQDNGNIGNNTFANITANGSPAGRTYFLGTFMSESLGSTIFSDAGIQEDIVETKSVAAINCIQHMTGAIVIEDTVGLRKTYHFGSGTLNEARPAIGTLPAGIMINTVAGSPNAATIATRFVNALKNTGGAAAGHGSFTGGTNASLAHFTQSVGGHGGNTPIIFSDTGVVGSATAKVTSILNDRTFASGSTTGGAVPILRGIVMAPSGVILHLSGNYMSAPSAPVISQDAALANDTVGRKGAVTGSVDVTNQEFVMMLNGLKGNATKSTVITASFDMTAPNYFANVLNTDPLSIEEKGHFLYGHYDIYPTLANVTGSGALSKKHLVGNKHEIAFLLTSSHGRAAAASANKVDYEDFRDRFSAAKTPFIISQDPHQDLFRFEAINDGAGESERIKISIENIVRSTSDSNLYGKFDVIIRRFSDTDEEKEVLESFRGLSLDPASTRYIGRAIGDQKIFYNFDNSTESQKIVVDGTHPVVSKFVRVILSDALIKNDVDDSALPLGYRGPNHLNTSGSLVASVNSSVYASNDILSRLTEPPYPVRESIAVGTGIQKRTDARLFWGMQTTRKVSASTPNKAGLPDESLKTFNKYFPTHRTDSIPFSEGNNSGAEMVNGTVRDSDKFNNNLFSMERVLVRTGSGGTNGANLDADPEMWHSASYIRTGRMNSVATDANKTRAFRVSDLDIAANRKYVKFTVPFQGGNDGTNIFNDDQLKLTNNAANREMTFPDSLGGTAGPTVASYRKAVDIMGSKADTEIKLLTIPGMREPGVTDFAISAVESRFDAMLIMDIEERDQFNTVITSSLQRPHVLNTVNDFKNRVLDTSFAAAYFPDVTVKDPGTGGLVQVPPSVAVLGAYSLNDKIGHPWFAPAGFTRGSLSAVETTAVKLNRTNLDDLYDSDINPITAFPGTGITVWGQKTLLRDASALDRVNVRRLLINVRRSVRNIANTLLFEPNRAETLEKFSSLVNPILQRVQEQSGVDRFKVVIDTTTTTQADVENNTIRGKIFLQPTRAVEFVALDFVVTNAGSELL